MEQMSLADRPARRTMRWLALVAFVAEVLRDGAAAFFTCWSYLHGGHLGSVAAATSSTRAILSHQAFNSWGEQRTRGATSHS